MAFFRYRPFLIYLVLILIVGSLFVSLILNWRVPLLSRLFLVIFSPVAHIPARLGEGLREGFERYTHLLRVEEENRRLREENERLRGRIVQLEERLRLYKNLKLLNTLSLLRKYPSIEAQVIYKPFNPFENYIVIDAGQAHNLRPEMPVVTATEEGERGILVGQVVEVAWRYAKVLPITAPVSAVDVLVLRSRERGLLRGRGWGKACLLDYVPAGADIREGDLLITSGMDGLFPKGLRVGRVIRILPDRRQGFFETIEVQPFLDLKKLEYVRVILKFRDFKP